MQLTHEFGRARGSYAKPKSERISDDGKSVVTEYHAITVDLPELAGTEKQVAWANRLRADAIRGKFAEMERSPARWAQAVEALPRFQEAIQAWINGRPKATDWIDAR